MRPREIVAVGRRASALSAVTALALVTLSEVAVAQPADPKAPAPAAPPASASAPKAPAPKPTTEAPAPKAPAPAPGAAPVAPPEPKPLPAPAEPGTEPLPPSAAKPTATPEAPTSPVMPLWPEPSADAAALENQGAARPKPATGPQGESVYTEDWWSHARPVFEIHGYFRLRTQLFHRFSLGRANPPGTSMWPRPTDDAYNSYLNGNSNQENTSARLCTPEEAELGTSDSPQNARYACDKALQGGANLRFRVNPELHISDNLRILSQIDLLDNLVLGSTPGGYNNLPGRDGGYEVVGRNGYAPMGFYDDTQVPPASGVNSFKDSIVVKRAWGEYASPVGELRFGRMPFHWGLGMMFNSGDGPDDDYQSTVDRIQGITGIKPLDLYFSVAWDFPNEGISSDAVALPNPEPYDLSQLDDVDQYVLSVVRKKTPELERLSLTRGELVLNAGFQFVYRQQTIADDRTTANTVPSGACDGSAAIGCTLGGTSGGLMGYVRREAEAFIPDLWLEARYKKFRFGLEAVTVQGTIQNASATQPRPDTNDEFKIAAWGVATEIEQKLVEDKLLLGFKFGWATGDSDVDGLVPFGDPTQNQHGDHTFSTFRFHPNYRVDLILNRNILTRVQGSYYFRPNVDYDFVRDPNGQRIGGGIAAIWTRASQFIQAPGHDRDLGIELDGRVYYQAKDGALNDLPGVLGGFYTELDYGVLFPMDGMGYPPGTANTIVTNQGDPEAADTRIAQTLRWFVGIMY